MKSTFESDDRKMDLLTNATPEEVFQLVQEYFTDTYMKVGRSAKISTLRSPSHMKVEFGSWFAAMGNPRGMAEVRIAKRDELTGLKVEFSFKKEYVKPLLFSVAILVFVGGYLLWQMLSVPLPVDELLGSLATALFFGLFIFAVLFLVSAVNTSLTKGKLIRDFTAFLQESTSEEERPSPVSSG